MQKKLRKYHFIQYGLMMVLCLSFLWNDYEEISYLSYLPLLIWIINVVVFIMEFSKQKAKKRLVLIIVCTILIGILFPDIFLMNSMAIIAGAIYLITLLMVMLKKGTLNNASPSTNTFPVGIFSKKHERLNLLLIGLSFVLALVLYLILDYFQIKIVLAIIITFICVMIFILVGSILINPLQKALNKFHMDLDYEAFMQTLEVLKQNKLHPDSLAYIDMVANNYLNLCDLEKAKLEFKDIAIPSFKNYLIYYRMFEIIYCINCNDYEQAVTLLESFKSNFKAQKAMALSLERSIQAYFTQDEIKEVEKIYPLTHKKKLVSLINANLLMVYYIRRLNFEKAQFYADFLQKNALTLKQMLIDSYQVLEQIEVIKILKIQAKKYPLMEVSDVIKLIYQNEMGGGHLILDSETSLAHLQKEYINIKGKTGHEDDEIGNGLVRISLYHYNGTLTDLNNIFIESSQQITGSKLVLKEKLLLINEWLKQDNPFLFSQANFEAELNTYLAMDCPMISHSDGYRINYQPAYRVIKKELYKNN